MGSLHSQLATIAKIWPSKLESFCFRGLNYRKSVACYQCAYTKEMIEKKVLTYESYNTTISTKAVRSTQKSGKAHVHVTEISEFYPKIQMVRPKNTLKCCTSPTTIKGTPLGLEGIFSILLHMRIISFSYDCVLESPFVATDLN